MDDILNRTGFFNPKKDSVVVQPDTGINTLVQKANPSDSKRKATSARNNSSESFAARYNRGVPIRRIMAESDSLLRDSLGTVTEVAGESFIIRKDERIGMGQYPVSRLEGTETEKTTDTLLEKISGVRNLPAIATMLQVEFWKSPLNYKGYKMSRNKLILFGISPGEPIRLFQSGENLYLQHHQQLFRLAFSDEFRQLERVMEPDILNKMLK